MKRLSVLNFNVLLDSSAKSIIWQSILTQAFLFIPPSIRKNLQRGITCIKVVQIEDNYLAYYNHTKEELVFNLSKFKELDNKFLFVFFHEIAHILDHLSKERIGEEFWDKFHTNDPIFKDFNDKLNSREMFADYFALWMLNQGKIGGLKTPLEPIKNREKKGTDWIILNNYKNEFFYIQKVFITNKGCYNNNHLNIEKKVG